MTTYGYCRISTPKQSIERQVRNIQTAHPDAHILQEAYTGTSLDRPEWSKLQKVLKPSDTIVFDSVSRMSRNADEGYAAYEGLYQRGIELIFCLPDGDRHIPVSMCLFTGSGRTEISD